MLFRLPRRWREKFAEALHWWRRDNIMAKRQKDKQNTTQKTKDWETRTPLKIGVNWGSPEGSVVPASLETPVVLLLSIDTIVNENDSRIVQLLFDLNW